MIFFFFRANPNPTFQKTHPGRSVNQFDEAIIVCVAYERSATVQNVTSEFRKAAIYPHNKHFKTLHY